MLCRHLADDWEEFRSVSSKFTVSLGSAVSVCSLVEGSVSGFSKTSNVSFGSVVSVVSLIQISARQNKFCYV